MEAIYANADKEILAGIGDVVMIGDTRAIVIDVKGILVSVLAVGTDPESGDTVVLRPRYLEELPASICLYRERQTLNL